MDGECKLSESNYPKVTMKVKSELLRRDGGNPRMYSGYIADKSFENQNNVEGIYISNLAKLRTY